MSKVISGRTITTLMLALFGLSAATGLASVQVPQTPLDSSTLTKYLDPLPVPSVIEGFGIGKGGRPVSLPKPLTITMSEFAQQVLPSDFAAGPLAGLTTVWGYNNSYPGPTVVARRGVPLQVRYLNNLMNPSLQKLLTVDQTLHWADPLLQMGSFQPYAGPVPTVTHLHGGEVESASDGGPDAWFTPGFGLRGPGWVSPVYNYPNGQEATSMFYHDHTLGATRLNLYAGLAGFYFITDPANEPRGLPSGKYEIGLAIQDRMFDTNGQLMFPDAGVNPAIHPFWTPEFFGDTIVVNGKVWPRVDVEQRRYRFHVLNGSNARFYNLSLENGATFYQVGTDGGLLDRPVALTSLLVAPGERADIIIDFGGLAVGTKILLKNDANAPFPNGDPVDPNTTAQIVQFNVVSLVGADTTVDPGTLPNLRPFNPIVRLEQGLTAQTPVRRLTLNENMGPNGPIEVLLNNSSWSAPATELPRVGSTEVWEITNMTADSHPIHLHLVQYQILNRQGYDDVAYMGVYNAAFPGGVYIPKAGPPPGGNPDVTPFLSPGLIAPDANELGWKDTIRMNPREVTRVLVRYAPQDAPLFGKRAARPGRNLFPFTPYLPKGSIDPLSGFLTGPGYVWHCHIVDHEDNEMMRPLLIQP